MLVVIYMKIASSLSFFNRSANTYFDGVIVSLVASFIFLALTEINHFLFSTIAKGRRAVLHFYVKVSRMQNRLDDVITGAYKFLMSAKTKWGPTYRNSSRKIASVAEGLLGILFSDQIRFMTTSERKEIETVLDTLMIEQEKGGFKSYNLGKFTTHCTAMVLFTIKKYHDLGIYQLNQEHYESLQKMAFQLLSTGTPYGWGTYNEVVEDEGLIRLLSTFWALRALNVWGFSGNEKYTGILSSLINCVPGGKFGFSLETQPKSSTIALFLILLKELENEHTQGIIFQKLSNKEVKQLLRFLVEDLHTSVETEEYRTDMHKDYEKLSWTHLSFFLSISALSQYLNLLNPVLYMKMLIAVSSVLKTQFAKDGHYVNDKLNDTASDPLTFPTAYAIMGLSDLRRNLDQRCPAQHS